MEEMCHRLAAVGHLTGRKYDRSLNNKEPLVIRFRVAAAAAVAKSKVRQGKVRQVPIYFKRVQLRRTSLLVQAMRGRGLQLPNRKK